MKLKLVAFYDSDIEGEIIEDVQESNLIHVALEYQYDTGTKYVFESFPGVGVRITLASRRLRGCAYKHFTLLKIPKTARTRMEKQLGCKYSWLSDLLAPFRIRIKRENYRNCVEAVADVMGWVGLFYPVEVVDTVINN